MEQVQAKKLVRILKNLDETELEFIKNTIDRHERNNVSIEEASEYNLIEPGQTVAFFDKKNVNRTGEVKKVNQKWVRIHDPKEQQNFYVLPAAILQGKSSLSKSTQKSAKQ